MRKLVQRGAALLLPFLLAAGVGRAQVVTSPSTTPGYDAAKQAAVTSQRMAARSGAQPAKVVLPRSSNRTSLGPTGLGTPVMSATGNCLIPVDASYATLAANDDDFVGPIALPFTFNLYGNSYNQVWVNNNGNISFTQGYFQYSADGFPLAGVPMIAAFWGDVDTRGSGNGLVRYKVNPTNMIITWDNVGYYAAHTDKKNTFQIVIGSSTDMLLGPSQNVSLRYGDMQWTTGDASGGAGGFGGTPATVGINKGADGAYVQVGRFNQNNAVYDGPGGNNDGVNYLDNQCFGFNVSNAGNIPPSANNLPANNTVNVTCGQTVTINPQFLAPEVNQTTTIGVNTGGLCGTTVSTTSGATATASIAITGMPCNVGTHPLVLTATDNGSPAGVTTVTLNVVVTSCCNLQLSAAVADATCRNGSDGTVTTTLTNATNPVTYAWSNGATTANLTGVPAGTYRLTATDANGCTASGSYTVGQPVDRTPVAGNDAVSAVACTPVIIAASTLLANDTDPQNATLQVADVLTPSSGTLVDNHNGTYTYTPAAGFTGAATFQYVIKKSDATVSYSANGHFYEYITANGITWTDARDAAAARTYQGMRGYLSTITSAGENAFAAAKLTGNGWIGASDAASEGVWKWVTGPEAGQQFWHGSPNGNAVNGAYTNWQAGEPNNYGDEDYAHFYNGVGTWNDFANSRPRDIQGYVVEYGGLESCIPVLTATGTVTVTVAPAPAPTVLTQNITIALDANGAATIAASQVDNGSSSACGIASLAVSPSTFGCANMGVNTVTLTATSNDGNTASGTAIVTVVDQTKPTAVAQVVTVYLDANGAASVTAAQVNNGSSDNCSVASVAVAPSTFDCSNVGANAVTLTVTDASGNVSTAPATVTVVDAIAPTFAACPANISVTAQPGDCTPAVNWTAPAAADNCSFTVASSHQPGARFTVGTTPVTYTVTDASGNTATCSFSVTVTPTPVVVTLSSPTYAGGFNIGCAGANSGAATAAVSGGCQPYQYAWSNGQTSATATGLAAGTYSVTVTDANNTRVTRTIVLTQPTPLTLSTSYSPLATFSGANPATIYLGYGQQSLTLAASATGGVAGYSYHWSPATGLNSTSGASVVASPTTTTTYTVTVTDQNGCTATRTVAVRVVDARCGNGNNLDKVIVCHNGHEICVSANAVPAHLAHGCYVGPCGSNVAARSGAATATAPVQAGSLAATPNPNNGRFEVLVHAATEGPVQVDLYDLTGRHLGQLFSGSLLAGQQQVLTVERPGLANGIYLVRMQSGGLVTSLRMSVVK